MKIVRLFAENIKRLKAVEIKPQDNLVIISGKNGQGKTTVLDCIQMAIDNRTAARNNPVPLRTGTDKGRIEVDTIDPVYYIVRKVTEAGTVLEVKNAQGDKVSSPQKLLDGFYSDLTFDPWEFSRKSEKDQRQMLSDVLFAITNGQVNIADFEAKHQVSYDARSEANREKKRLTTLLTNIRPPTGTDPRDEISATDLIASISDAMKVESEARSLLASLNSTRQEVGDLKRKLDEAEKRLTLLSEAADNMTSIPDVQALKAELENIQATNKRAREVQEYDKISTALRSVEESIQGHNDTMELLEIQKAEALESSPLPVKGLTITPDGIMVATEDGHSVPFCQASAAQRLRISTAIAMAANPQLKVIRITDGSLLDDDSMKILTEMAKAQDYDIWIEYASRNDQDRMGIYIEDGEVA